MDKIFIIWRHYDEINIEEFNNVEGAEPRLAQLQASIDREEYDHEILAVIQGRKMVMESVEVTTKIRLRQP